MENLRQNDVSQNKIILNDIFRNSSIQERRSEIAYNPYSTTKVIEERHTFSHPILREEKL